MPAKSKKQQRFMGMVHAYQKGELKDASPSVKKAAKSIDPDDATHFAETKHKGLPEKVRKKKKSKKRIHSFESFVNENYNNIKKIDNMSNQELEDENKHFIKLQNKGKLTPQEERRWKKISKKLNEKD